MVILKKSDLEYYYQVETLRYVMKAIFVEVFSGVLSYDSIIRLSQAIE